MDSSLFDREKIYEELEKVPQPEDYDGKLNWTVQLQVAETNGMHYRNSVRKLTEYPIPPIPIEDAAEPKLFLDIGCGWGRWLVAAARKNYLPIGIDLRLEFCEVSRSVARDTGVNAYTVAADLKNLPFQSNVFDVIWSFSVIQHTHIERLTACLQGISRILKAEKSYCYLEFPNKNGIRNRFGPARRQTTTMNDYNSWDVRYYSPREYKAIFRDFFDNFQYYTHSSVGIGILPGDIRHANGLMAKTGILLSRSLSKVFKSVPMLKAWSDSIYIKCYKNTGTSDDQMDSVNKLREAHLADPENNLNILHLLCCPATRDRVSLSEDGQEIISVKAGLAYPVRNGIPIMIPAEARAL